MVRERETDTERQLKEEKSEFIFRKVCLCWMQSFEMEIILSFFVSFEMIIIC